MESNRTIEHLEIIEWAFEKGFSVAKEDMREGVHIKFSEIKKHFLQDLREFIEQKKPKIASPLLNKA